MRPATAPALLWATLLLGCSDHATLFLSTPNGDTAIDDTSSDDGPALRLAGPDARITLAYTAELDLTDHFTLEAWIWPFATGAGEMLLCKSDQEREDKSVRILGAANTPVVSLEMTSLPSPATLAPDVGLTALRWHHLALSYGEGQLRLFLDGKLTSWLSRVDPVADGTGTLYLGACPAEDWLPPRDVALSDVRFSRTARYSADFSPAPQLPADADAVALYRLDEHRALIATDAGPHALDASIDGSAAWVRLPRRSAD